jgi:predicted dehydrogenase
VHTEQIRIGLAGCGYWGSKHLRVFNELPDCEVAALCEPSLVNVAKQPRAFLPPLVTADYDEFLSANIDAVVIATPAATHFALARRALERGKHVLVEKPFTTSSADALALLATAKQRGLTLGVGHTYLYHPAVELLRRLVASGELGGLRYVHTARLNFGTLQRDADVLWDLAPHDLSILLYVLQREPIQVAARGVACVTSHLREVAHLEVQFEHGPSAYIYVSWLEPMKVRRLTFVGEEKTVVYDDVAPSDTLRVYDKTIRLSWRNGTENANVPQYLQGDTTVPLLSEREPLKSECSDFLESVRTGATPRSDGRVGLTVVRLLEAASRSLDNGGAWQLVQTEAPARGTATHASLLLREPSS